MTERWTRRLGTLGLAVGLVWGVVWGVGCAEVEETQLRGTNEVPPVTTSATGTAEARLEGDTLTVTGSFNGLMSNLTLIAGSPAHVHEAAKGENGPVVFSLGVSSTDQRNGTFRGSLDLTEAQKRAFRDGRYYVNVHTVDNPGGELRGQFEP